MEPVPGNFDFERLLALRAQADELWAQSAYWPRVRVRWWTRMWNRVRNGFWFPVLHSQHPVGDHWLAPVADGTEW